MPINPDSELTADVEASIAKAYDARLSAREQKLIRKHLAFILTKLKEPNTLIEPTKAALTAIDFRKKWHEKPLGILGLGIIGSLVVAAIVYKLGWN